MPPRQIPLFGGAALGVLAVIGFGRDAQADEIHVFPGGLVQAAIDAAFDGDEIIVHQGTYYGPVDLLGKAITLRSTEPENPSVVENTVLDGNGAPHVVCCDSGEGQDTVIAGLTITGGDADGTPPEDRGGGVFCCDGSSPIVLRCVITDNHAEEGGGGIGCYSDSSPTISRCTIAGNTATSFGGGVYCSTHADPILIDTHIVGNTAELQGAGVYCHTSSNPTISRCTITANTAASLKGGGVYCYYYSSPLLLNCAITGNTAGDRGGGVACGYESHPTITNCTVTENTALDDGGGVFCWQDAMPTITNCILWHDSPQEFYVDGSSEPAVTYCDVQGGWSGTGNINVDPNFADAPGEDFHIASGSPCIDAGTNYGEPRDMIVDLDGNPRFVDDPDTDDTGAGPPPIVDMGCYEYQVSEPCPADITGDDMVDVLDLLEVLGQWGGAGSADITGDGVVDVLDLLEVLGAWGPCR